LVHTRLEYLKNVEVILSSFAAFRRRHPSALLHIVGEGSAGRDLQALARRLDVSQATRFHGFLSRTDLSAVYDACDVFALLPIDEPFGMVFPEAAARGLLIVGPDHGGPLEILDGGKLGWVCDPFAEESVLDALERVFALSDSEANERRAAADAACRQRYSQSAAGPQLERAVLG
jgi:glycosyltransferase involved in cell wall biosynthesis